MSAKRIKYISTHSQTHTYRVEPLAMAFICSDVSPRCYEFVLHVGYVAPRFSYLSGSGDRALLGPVLYLQCLVKRDHKYRQKSQNARKDLGGKNCSSLQET